MNLIVKNTLTGKKEVFKPLNGNKVGVYVCGPTVYDSGHLGHGRSAVAFDVIQKYLRYKGFDVTYVSNYTDVEDKIINRANEEGITPEELIEQVIPEYERDYGKLRIAKPDHQPKATEYIGQMIELVQKLMDKEYAYELDDGIYFEIEKFSEYGKLSGQKQDELRAGSRVEKDDKKKHPHDFVLWKKSKPGEPKWDSPWGDGRPGWHLECSAMSMNLLGETFDIHGGGMDLVFPHHEDEIAQSEGATGKDYVKYWIHNGFINIDDEKMSKSLGNFFTLKEIFEKYDPLAVRHLFLGTHYRSPINFSDKILDQSVNALSRLRDFLLNLRNYQGSAENTPNLEQILSRAEKDFEKKMDDDFDTAGALGALFNLVKEVNILMQEDALAQEDKARIEETLTKLDSVLSILPEIDEEVDFDIDKLIEERNKARAEKNFARSDEIRDELAEKGIILEDKPEGTIWKKA